MSFSEKLYQNFIEDDRWLLLVNGLKVTILVTLFALLVGVIIGFTVAIIRSHDGFKLHGGISRADIGGSSQGSGSQNRAAVGFPTSGIFKVRPEPSLGIWYVSLNCDGGWAIR